MIRVLVYAYRDWSFLNLAPVLDSPQVEATRWWREQGPMPDVGQFDVVVTCEPHIAGWRRTWPEVMGKLPVLAMQQSLYYDREVNPNAAWPFERFMLWGRQQYDVCRNHEVREGRLIITGNPRFDGLWGLKTWDDGYTLILGSGGETIDAYPDRKQWGECVFQGHPNMTGNKLLGDTVELIKGAKRVVFRETGAGIIAMILNKPVWIEPVRPGQERKYMPCPLYGDGVFGGPEEYGDYRTWAVGTGSGATERVLEVLQHYG